MALRTLAFALVLICLLLFFLYPPIELTFEQQLSIVIIVLTILLWATAVIPEHLTALIFFLAVSLSGVASNQVIFSGFTSPAFWLVFAGLIIGIAIKSSGLGGCFARTVAWHLGGSYPLLISGIVFIGVAMAFLMPSAMGRIVLLVPMSLAVADHFSFKAGSNGRTGIVLAAVLGTFYPAFSILPSNVANMILAGTASAQYDIQLEYARYLLLHFPVLGLMKAIIIVGIIVYFYPDKLRQDLVTKTKVEGLSLSAKKVSVILMICLGFWLTDFYHQISPAWIALAGAIIILFPAMKIVTSDEFSQGINVSVLLFVAAVLSLAELIRFSDVTSLLVQSLALTDHLWVNGNDASNFMMLSLMSTVTGFVTVLPGVPAVMTPLAADLAELTGFNIHAILMTQVVGFSMSIFAYQAPPILLGMKLANETPTVIIKMSIILAILTIIILLPLDYLWWKILGEI